VDISCRIGRMRRSFLVFLVTFLISGPVFAQANQIYQCGVPETYDLEIYGDFSVCDFYQRQLAYKPEADKFKRQLAKRQALFAAPRTRAILRYKADLARMHYGEDNRMTVVGDATGLLQSVE